MVIHQPSKKCNVHPSKKLTPPPFFGQASVPDIIFPNFSAGGGGKGGFINKGSTLLMARKISAPPSFRPPKDQLHSSDADLA